MDQAAVTLSFLTHTHTHPHTRTHATAEGLLSMTLPAVIRKTQYSPWGFTPPCVNVLVCVRERVAARDHLCKGLNRRSFVKRDRSEQSEREEECQKSM